MTQSCDSLNLNLNTLFKDFQINLSELSIFQIFLDKLRFIYNFGDERKGFGFMDVSDDWKMTII